MRLMKTSVWFFALALTAGAATRLYFTDFSPSQFVLQPTVIESPRSLVRRTWAINARTGLLEEIHPWGAWQGCLYLTPDAVVDLSTIGDHILDEVRNVPGPNGTRVYALYQELKINTAGAPTHAGSSQNPFLIRRHGPSDIGDGYHAYWIRIQPDLLDQLSPGSPAHWRVLTEWKTAEPRGIFDWRITTLIYRGADGALYWVNRGDGINMDLKTPYFRDQKTPPHWNIENRTVPVPNPGEWFFVEVFWHRSTGPEGRFWQTINGRVIFDHRGRNVGPDQVPIDRVFLANLYTGGRAPAFQWITGLEIWDGFPCGDGISCYSARTRPEARTR